MNYFFLILFLALLNSLYPQTEIELYQTGIKFLSNGKIYDAITNFNSVLQINSENLNSKKYLAYCYYLLGKYSLALDIISTLPKEDLFVNLFLAELYYQTGDLLNAKTEFLKIAETAPSIKLVHIRLYELLKVENKEKADMHYILIFQAPKTKYEELLPDVPEKGLPEKIVLPEIDIPKRTDSVLQFLTVTNQTNQSEIILTLKKKQIFPFFSIKNLFRDLSLNFFIEKLTQIFITSIFLALLGIYRRIKDKKISNVVLRTYRIHKR